MVQDQEPLFAREGLFRQKLNQLRKSGHIPQNIKSDSQSRIRELEQGGYLDKVKSTLEHADPKEMERITLLDRTTELYNHSTIMRILGDEFKRSRRYKHDCTVLMLLIDGLYGIQQSAGAEVSDNILKGVADFVMKEVRDVDIPARYSAEQLLVVCPETNADGVAVLAERLRSKIP
ncbi:MAG TPA: diguanylate cyclase, partial [Candidatus Melainabacteria bacterium]|nr:diguanylate cyclase [Candidatus Melainabacteria bacterium]